MRERDLTGVTRRGGRKGCTRSRAIDPCSDDLVPADVVELCRMLSDGGLGRRRGFDVVIVVGTMTRVSMRRVQWSRLGGHTDDVLSACWR